MNLKEIIARLRAIDTSEEFKVFTRDGVINLERFMEIIILSDMLEDMSFMSPAFHDASTTLTELYHLTAEIEAGSWDEFNEALKPFGFSAVLELIDGALHATIVCKTVKILIDRAS